jgi:DNA invertase Pin-like site-specific DNA recombinase
VPRVALYARVSTRDQDCEAQLRDLRAFAALRAWDVTEFVDNGYSGAKTERPALDALLAAVRVGEFQVVATWKFDRFARSTRFLINSLEEFQALGVQFVSLHDGVDTTTPAGRFLFHIIAALAEFERETIRERVRSGLARAQAEGRRGGRRWRPLDEGRLRTLLDTKVSLRRIAKELGCGLGTVRRRIAGFATPTL